MPETSTCLQPSSTGHAPECLQSSEISIVSHGPCRSAHARANRKSCNSGSDQGKHRKLGICPRPVQRMQPRTVKANTAKWLSHVPSMQCRLEHESPIAAFAARLPDDDVQNNHGQHAHNPNLPVQPAFVDDLVTRLARMGYDVTDPDFDVPVRTWYIDHATIRRWTAPRNLQLVGPPRGWEAQFSSLWVDQINPDEWFDVTVIYPDPPRTPRNSFLIMDLVVTQSLQLDRFPGLVTIFPTMHEAFELFSVAASFEPHVSGFDIAQAADAADMCRYQECTITFGWQDIPYTLRPHHVMAHGDGFQLVVRHQPARLMSSSSSQAGSSTDSSTSRITPQDMAPHQTGQPLDVDIPAQEVHHALACVPAWKDRKLWFN